MCRNRVASLPMTGFAAVIVFFLLGEYRSAAGVELIGVRPSGANKTRFLSIETNPFSAEEIGSAPFTGLSGLTAHPVSSFLYASSGFGGDGTIYRFFSLTNFEPLGPSGFQAVPGLAFDSDGTLYGSAATDRSGDALITINTLTGQGTLVGHYGAGIAGLDALAYDFKTDTLYAGSNFIYDGSSGDIFSINRNTGAASYLVSLVDDQGNDLPASLAGLTFDAGGNLFGSLGGVDGRIVSIDLDRGTFAILGDASDGSVSDIVAVPTIPQALNEVDFPGSTAVGLTIDAARGRIYAAGSQSTTFCFDLDLNVIGSLTSPSSVISGIAFVGETALGADTLFWINGNGTLYVTDVAGTLLDTRSVSSPMGGATLGLTWDEQRGTLWSVDVGFDEFFEFTFEGKLTGTVFSTAQVVGGIASVDGGRCFDIVIRETFNGPFRRLQRRGRDGSSEGVEQVIPMGVGLQFSKVAWHPTGSTGVDVEYMAANNGRIYEVPVNLPCDAPANDSCFSADLVTVGTVMGTTAGSSNDGAASCDAASPDVWYRFIAFTAGSVRINTCGTNDAPTLDSGVDTLLAVFEGCSGPELDCNDDWPVGSDPGACVGVDGGGVRDSALIVPVAEGVELLIRVATRNGSGDFVLNIADVPPPGPANDSCAAAAAILPGTTAGTLANATPDLDATCSVGGADVWYRFNATAEGTLRVNTCGTHDAGGLDTGVDTTLSVFSGCGGAELDCNNDWPVGSDPGACVGFDSGSVRDAAVSVSLRSGEEILIRVSTTGATGPFQLTVDFLPTNPDFIRGDANGNGSFNGLSDALFMLQFQFQNGPPPRCEETVDADGSGSFNGVADGLFALNHQFQGGPPPPAPYPACGADPDPGGSLGCLASRCP